MIYTSQKSKRKPQNTKKKQALQASWNALMEKWDVKPNVKKTNSQYVNPAIAILRERSNRHIPSVDTGVGIAPKKSPIEYTGDAMIGIGQMHKSNAVPIFKQEDAEDLAKMRR